MNRKQIQHGGEKAEHLPHNSRRTSLSASLVSTEKKMPHGSTLDEQKDTLSANALKLRRALIVWRVKSYGAA